MRVPMNIEVDASMDPYPVHGHGRLHAHHAVPAAPSAPARGPTPPHMGRRPGPYVETTGPRGWRGRAEAGPPGWRRNARLGPHHHYYGQYPLDPIVSAPEVQRAGATDQEISLPSREELIAAITEAFDAVSDIGTPNLKETPVPVEQEGVPDETSFPAISDSFKYDIATPIAESTESTSTVLVESEQPVLNVTFIDDVSIPDGTPLPPAAEFTKVWRLQNTGTAIIPAGTAVVFAVGENFGHKQGTVKVEEDVAVGANFLVSLPGLRAPGVPGETYTGFWRLAGEDGQVFGHRLWIE
ncbi:hypothetical protein QFC22_003969 [Naganishia vaughanmartiniae]|uniref:Uncharacterized protein n=1 Tax=Naganishia vaughanmartiniae TaxID=1424756 RepID=A0ACC2X411_9TREE|nr:hypothetical protein QFC22_003969 [Naganishia vaughanmartiniae]